MPFVSVTRLRLRKRRYLPAFGYFTVLSYVQAWRSNGNIRLFLRNDANLTFWTVTLWSDVEAMRRFRNSGAHLKAMKGLALWCDEATYAHWTQESDERPDLGMVCDRLLNEGVVSRVQYPSADHAGRNFPRPPWADPAPGSTPAGGSPTPKP